MIVGANYVIVHAGSCHNSLPVKSPYLHFQIRQYTVGQKV